MKHVHGFAEANFRSNDDVRRGHAGIWLMWVSATATAGTYGDLVYVG